MTDEQKKLSEAREEGYKIAESKKSEKNESSKELDKSYYESVVVNGIKIEVLWIEFYRGKGGVGNYEGSYAIRFPELDLKEERLKKPAPGGNDSRNVEINVWPKLAKKVFDHIVEFAQTESDAFKVRDEVERYKRDDMY